MPRLLPVFLLTTLVKTAHASPADAANAAVPGNFRDILSFVVKPHQRQYGAFDAVVPAGWGYDPDTQTYRPPPTQLPPHGKRIGFSSVRVWTTCAGTCEDKDWAAVIEAKVQEYTAKGYVIERDENPAPGQRLVVSKHADKRVIARFFTKAGGSRYFLCEAEVDRFAQPAQAAFEAACAGLVIKDWR